MKKTALFLLLASPVFGALTVTLAGTTPTQAILQEQGFSGVCTVVVSATPGGPAIPDFDGTEYSGASTDTGRPDTITSTDGLTRTVTVGHQTGDRALRNVTAYYYAVSGCGTASGSFATANLASGTTRTEQSPFNASQWGNLGMPAFDWTAAKNYTDPLTGAAMIPLSVSGVLTWRTAGGATGAASCIAGVTGGHVCLPFTDVSGGTGWTSPGDIINGATSTATTGNVNPVDLYLDMPGFPYPSVYNLSQIMQDIGIVLWGSGSSGTAADRVVNFCLFTNPVSGCASNTIQATLPTGSVAHVLSGGADPDGPFPASFPSSPFQGWVTNANPPLIKQENFETFGNLTVSGSVLTIAAPTPSQHFSPSMLAGQKIFITGAACTNSLCTAAAAPSSAGTLTVNETPGTGGSVAFRSYGWGLRVWKDNANGTATIGVKTKLAGSFSPPGVTAGGFACSHIPETSADGKVGYLCLVTQLESGGSYLAFIANDGTVRFLALQSAFTFSDVAGNVMYQGTSNGSGSFTVNKITYTGDYQANQIPVDYGCEPSGSSCPSSFVPSLTTADLMPHITMGSTQFGDLDQQIEFGPIGGVTYNSTLFGTWTTGSTVGFYGASGHFAMFCNVYDGQGQPAGGGPGWCAVVDLTTSPAHVVRLIHTLDATGNNAARWGSLHFAGSSNVVPGVFNIGLDGLNAADTTKLYGGPYAVPVLAVLESDGVTWNANTTAHWPDNGGTGQPDWLTTCPSSIFTCSGLPTGGGTPYTTLMTIRVSLGGPCNQFPHSGEVTANPCPWNGAFAQYPVMRAGDSAMDQSEYATDDEQFRVLAITPCAGVTCVLLARNATYEYCGISPWQGLPNPLGQQSASQLYHANGWNLMMIPGLAVGCAGSGEAQEMVGGVVQELGRSFLLHSTYGLGMTPGNVNISNSTAGIYNAPFATIGNVPPPATSILGVNFAGNDAAIGAAGGLQSYPDNSQLPVPSTALWAVDTNPFVSCAIELLGCGPVRTVTPVTGNIYIVQALGTAAASAVTYKTQPMIGWAGQYGLKDVSGPSSNIAATPFTMCYAFAANECRSGSSANTIYVNVPVEYDPGYCTGSVSWASIPCIFFGSNAPAGGIRQFGIYTDDTTGTKSRWLSYGWSSMGRTYPYTYSTVHPQGNWVIQQGTNLMDGFSMSGFMISVPPWVERRDPANVFKSVGVRIPQGAAWATVQFGYSQYQGAAGAASLGYCTARAEACLAGTATAPFAFASETYTGTACTSGCIVNIPAIAGNTLYYRVGRSSSAGSGYLFGDTQAVSVP